MENPVRTALWFDSLNGDGIAADGSGNFRAFKVETRIVFDKLVVKVQH